MNTVRRLSPFYLCFLCALLFCGVGAASARAEVTRLEITERTPFADGRDFPGVGAYERLRGVAHFSVDPKAEANRRVVDLEHAPTNAAGRVEFQADFDIVAPVDRSRANGTLLYDVNNRGGITAYGVFNGGPGADYFLMRKGYVVVASGWIGELLPGPNRLRLNAPVATDATGGPIRGRVRAEMTTDAPAERLSLAGGNHGSYRPTERALREATLTWRLREKDPRIPIPRGQFRLEVQPSGEGAKPGDLPRIDLVLAGGGFRPGYLYELIYEAEGPIVQGLGFAGIRDIVSFLKRETGAANPLRRTDGRPAVDRAIGFGVSQSGRALRLFLYDGFNADERGRIVFDGLMPHVAGGGLGFFNHRFASPTRTNDQHDGHAYPVDQFPFTYGDEKDPFTGRTDGILRAARAAGVVPRIMHTQTSAEYWHRSGSLVHTDPLGKRDAALPPEVRLYAFGGAQHGSGSGIPAGAPRPGGGPGGLPGNPTDYRPLLRGLLTALNAWVREGTEPPPSRYPRISGGTLVGWRESESGWRALPGVRYPEVIQQPEFLDHGPEFGTKRRLTRLPPVSKGSYVVRVPACGPDDNDRGTLLLPTVAVPVATFTGWNLRHLSIGAEGELLSLAGGYVPFARTKAEREASGDPRPSLEERYPAFDAYRERFTAHARDLVARRYLLEEDIPALLDLARKQPGW